MRTAKFAILFTVAAAFVVGWLIVNQDKRPDADQIRDLIERGRRAIEHKSLDAAMSCISENFSNNMGLNRDRLRMLAADAFRANMSYEVVMDAPDVTVNGDQAQAKTHVAVSGISGGGREPVFSGEVALRLAKERVHRYLIFPTREWKITGIDGLGRIMDFGP